MATLDRFDRMKEVALLSVAAIGPFLESVTVYLAARGPEEEWKSASGTLLTINSRYFVITCAHFLKVHSAKSIQISYGEKYKSYPPITPFINSWMIGGGSDEPLDLGCLELDPAYVPTIFAKESFIGASRLCLDDRLAREDMYVLVGFPSQLIRTNGDNNRIGVQPFLLGTTVEEFDGMNFTAYYDETSLMHLEKGGEARIPLPHGISGGAFWKLNMPLDKDTFWSTESIQLIGIQHQWWRERKSAQGNYVKFWLETFSKTIPLNL
jgi:hypothetical protein